MNGGDITIVLDDPRREYMPGEMLSGEYRWEAANGAEIRKLELSVLWHTEGKGDEDFGVHFFDHVNVEDGGGAGRQGSARFSLQLPNSPLSYDGALVKIGWCVRVRAFLRRGKELVGERSFQLGRVPSVRVVFA